MKFFKFIKICFIASLVTARFSNSHNTSSRLHWGNHWIIWGNHWTNGNSGQLRTPILTLRRQWSCRWFVDCNRLLMIMLNCWRVNESWTVDITEFLIQKLSAVFATKSSLELGGDECDNLWISGTCKIWILILWFKPWGCCWCTQEILVQFNRKKDKSAQRRRKHCGLAVVRRSQKILPRRKPLPGAQDGQNLISWRWSLPLPTNPVWWGSMHAISSYRANRPTHTQTHPQTGPITIHCGTAS